MKVVVFQRDCGATTEFSTQASLVAADEVVPNESGNLFIADAEHGVAPSGERGGPELRVRWIDGATVELAHHEYARVFKSESSVEGVRVALCHIPLRRPQVPWRLLK